MDCCFSSLSWPTQHSKDGDTPNAEKYFLANPRRHHCYSVDVHGAVNMVAGVALNTSTGLRPFNTIIRCQPGAWASCTVFIAIRHTIGCQVFGQVLHRVFIDTWHRMVNTV